MSFSFLTSEMRAWSKCSLHSPPALSASVDRVSGVMGVTNDVKFSLNAHPTSNVLYSAPHSLPGMVDIHFQI